MRLLCCLIILCFSGVASDEMDEAVASSLASSFEKQVDQKTQAAETQGDAATPFWATPMVATDEAVQRKFLPNESVLEEEWRRLGVNPESLFYPKVMQPGLRIEAEASNLNLSLDWKHFHRTADTMPDEELNKYVVGGFCHSILNELSRDNWFATLLFVNPFLGLNNRPIAKFIATQLRKMVAAGDSKPLIQMYLDKKDGYVIQALSKSPQFLNLGRLYKRLKVLEEKIPRGETERSNVTNALDSVQDALTVWMNLTVATTIIDLAVKRGDERGDPVLAIEEIIQKIRPQNLGEMMGAERLVHDYAGKF